MDDLIKKARYTRLSVISLIEKANRGHIGGTFSCIEILVALYYKIMNIKQSDPNRDKFILSKGHACTALYYILLDLGIMSQKMFDSYCDNGGLGGQLDINIPGVEWNTGSLGHCIGVASGIALANKMDNMISHVFVVAGDGEFFEGSIWEGIMFAGKHSLGVTCIVDYNKLSVTSVLEDELVLNNLSAMVQPLGWNFYEVDGHSIQELVDVLSKSKSSTKPSMILAHTIKGKGVKSMENISAWHNKTPTLEDLRIAREEIKCH